MMKKDLATRKDIELLIYSFYEGAMKDAKIGHFFTEVADLSLEEHLPKICDFWESLLFGAGIYKGNPMLVHIALDKQSPLTEAHFEQWKKLFFETLDTYFEGEKADEAKRKATNIARLMLYKIGQDRENWNLSH